jgi:hypothetical protein
MQDVSGCTGLSGVILVSTVQNKSVYTADLGVGGRGSVVRRRAAIWPCALVHNVDLCDSRKHFIYTA